MATAKTTTKQINPEGLAAQLHMSPKVLRAWLRKTYTRSPKEKGTSWVLNPVQVKAARKQFSKAA
jgi:hypothetical protein